MFEIVVLLTIMAILPIVFVICVYYWVKKKKYPPVSKNKVEELNAELYGVGFAYDPKIDCFYSIKDCWQREMGYCRLYDEAAPMFHMVMDCEPITFDYDGKKWLIELWKGQYGITTGGEIGIYNTTGEEIHHEKWKGSFYHAVSDAEMLPMWFVLKKGRRNIMKREAVHWWLTGFKLGDFSSPKELTMKAGITFPKEQMREVFVDALLRQGYKKREIHVRKCTVWFHYRKPHVKDYISPNQLQQDVVQAVNYSNCILYEKVTGRYDTTMDKLSYLKAMAPDLYHFMIRSIYGKAFYETFGWLIEIIKPTPKPPKPPKPECKKYHLCHKRRYCLVIRHCRFHKPDQRKCKPCAHSCKDD